MEENIVTDNEIMNSVKSNQFINMVKESRKNENYIEMISKNMILIDNLKLLNNKWDNSGFSARDVEMPEVITLPRKIFTEKETWESVGFRFKEIPGNEFVYKVTLPRKWRTFNRSHLELLDIYDENRTVRARFSYRDEKSIRLFGRYKACYDHDSSWSTGDWIEKIGFYDLHKNSWKFIAGTLNYTKRNKTVHINSSQLRIDMYIKIETEDEIENIRNAFLSMSEQYGEKYYKYWRCKTAYWDEKNEVPEIAISEYERLEKDEKSDNKIYFLNDFREINSNTKEHCMDLSFTFEEIICVNEDYHFKYSHGIVEEDNEYEKSDKDKLYALTLPPELKIVIIEPVNHKFLVDENGTIIGSIKDDCLFNNGIVIYTDYSVSIEKVNDDESIVRVYFDNIGDEQIEVGTVEYRKTFNRGPRDYADRVFKNLLYEAENIAFKNRINSKYQNLSTGMQKKLN